MVDAITQIILAVLHTFNQVTGSYGLDLILLAVFIKAILYYPTQQQYKSMHEMQKIQPQVEAIQKKYKDDPERSQKELMALYQEHNINPLGGCLPLLIQMPILFSIWRAILSEPSSFENAYFLWIHPGPLQSRYPHLFASSLADPDLTLVIFYGITMFLSQQINSSQMKGNQKYLGTFMSLGFSFLVWHYRWPCALVLYWSVFSILSLLQQKLVMSELQADSTPTSSSNPSPAAPASTQEDDQHR